MNMIILHYASKQLFVKFDAMAPYDSIFRKRVLYISGGSDILIRPK